jgi:hypothetical protein
MSTDQTPCRQRDLLAVSPLLEEVAVVVVDTAVDPTAHTLPDRDPDHQRPDEGAAEEAMEPVDMTIAIPDDEVVAAASTATEALRGTEVVTTGDEKRVISPVA